MFRLLYLILSLPLVGSSHLIADVLYSVTDLGLIQAFGINHAGQVVGTGPTNHASIFSNGQITDLGTLGGNFFSTGYAINNNGEVVGTSFTRSGSRTAFLYSNGQMMNLWPGSEAYAINDAGQVVGGGRLSTWPTSCVSLHGRPDDGLGVVERR